MPILIINFFNDEEINIIMSSRQSSKDNIETICNCDSSDISII